MDSWRLLWQGSAFRGFKLTDWLTEDQQKILKVIKCVCMFLEIFDANRTICIYHKLDFLYMEVEGTILLGNGDAW